MLAKLPRPILSTCAQSIGTEVSFLNERPRKKRPRNIDCRNELREQRFMRNAQRMSRIMMENGQLPGCHLQYING